MELIYFYVAVYFLAHHFKKIALYDMWSVVITNFEKQILKMAISL